MNATNPWKTFFFHKMPGKPHPLIVSEHGILPAASLWSQSRHWVNTFRELDLSCGDRVVLMPNLGMHVLPVLVAGLWEAMTMVLIPANHDPQTPNNLLEQFDARLIIAKKSLTEENSAESCQAMLLCNDQSLPMEASLISSALRVPKGPLTPDTRVILRTSGTQSGGKWIALSDHNLWHSIEQHARVYADGEHRLLSVLPWYHCFGFVLDALLGIFHAHEIHRLMEGAKQIDRLITYGIHERITHFNAVPLIIERILTHPQGRAFLQQLQGGIVGGAHISPSLAETLQQTRLRVGYGQTEASPGITLGEPGDWQAGWLGQAVGCELRRDEDGVLAFRGANACLGEWKNQQLVRLPPDRWVRTGDLGHADQRGWWFDGRQASQIKLSNGKFFSAEKLEQAVLDQHRHITRCMVSLREAGKLCIAVSTRDSKPAPSPEELVPILADWSKQAVQTSSFDLLLLDEARWQLTPKGEVDRRQPPWVGYTHGESGKSYDGQ